MPKALIVEILADAKQFGAELDRAAGKTRSFGKAAGVAGLAIAGGLAYGLEKSVKSATDFQSSMQLLTTQAGVSEKSLGQLKQGVLALAGPTATAPEELAKGIYHLSSQGLRGAKALDALKIAAEGARIGQANLEDVTNALGAVVVSNIKGVSNLRGAMGALNATVGAGDMRMQDLADAMGTGLAANAKVAGVSLVQVSAALAVFGDNNIRGAKAGTLLSSTMRVMGHQSTAAAAALKDIGVSSDILQKKLSTQGLTGAIDYLKARIADTHKPLYQVSSDLSEAFGGKQATGIKLLLAESDRLHRKLDEVKAGASGFGQAWQQTSQTTAFKFDQMKAAMSSVAINIGSALLPAVTTLANDIANLTGWLSQHATVAKIAVAALGLLAATLIGVSVATKLSTAATVAWTAITRIAAAQMWVLNAALDANPIGIVVLAVEALAIAFALAWEKSRTFRNVVTGAWNDIKAVTSTVFGFVRSVITGAINDAIAAFRTVKSIGSHIWDGIKAIWNSTIGAEINAIIGLVKTLIGWLEKAMGIVHAVASAAKTIGGVFSSNTKGPPGGPRGWGPPPKHAAGGIVMSPQIGMIGEAGPEAIIPLSSPRAQAMLGGGVTVHVGPVYGTVDAGFAQKLSRELATQLRGGRAPQLQQAIQAI